MDGCFERAGFNPDKIYTPQGDASFYQCIGTAGSGPCSMDSVFPGFDELSRDLVPLVDPKSGELPAHKVPRCPKCGGNTFLNLRGERKREERERKETKTNTHPCSASAGSWFLPTRHNATGRAFETWIEDLRKSKKRVAILEVGCGLFSTPIVTRFQMESLARDLGAALIRVNPTEHGVPRDLSRAVGIPAGWDAALPELTHLVSLIAKEKDKDKGKKATVTAVAALAAEQRADARRKSLGGAAKATRRSENWRRTLHHLMMM